MAAQAKTTASNTTGRGAKKQPLMLQPRDNTKKKRGITQAGSEMFIESFGFGAEFAQAGRRTMSITNTMLKGMEGEVFFDAVEELMSRGLTAEQAIAYMEAA